MAQFSIGSHLVRAFRQASSFAQRRRGPGFRNRQGSRIGGRAYPRHRRRHGGIPRWPADAASRIWRSIRSTTTRPITIISAARPCGARARRNGATASARQLKFSILSFTTMYCIWEAATGIKLSIHQRTSGSRRNRAGITGGFRLWDADVERSFFMGVATAAGSCGRAPRPSDRNNKRRRAALRPAERD